MKMKTTMRAVKSSLMLGFLSTMLTIAGSVEAAGVALPQARVKIAPLLGAYAYLAHNHGPLLKQQMDSHKSFPEFERFEAALTNIGGADLVNQVGSTEQEFVVPSDEVGFILDLSQQNKTASGMPSYTLVTTPSGEDEKVFVILAMQSPARVTIFWMDKSLNGAVIYDSSKAGLIGNVSQGTPITSVSFLHVLPGGHLKLGEFVRPSSLPTQQPRVFMLSFTPNPSMFLLGSKGISK